MKNNYTTLFIIGIMIGGVLMLTVIAFNTWSGANQTSILPPTRVQGPRLIALEPTGVRREPTQTPLPPTTTARTGVTPIKAAIRSTPTPLLLSNEQKSEIIGYSMEERPLQVYTFGDGEHERMIVAGIHGGDEWNTITLANQLIQHLNQNPADIPDDVTLYILPNLNPDGETRTHNKYGRLNANGVDLNRNFPTNWQQDWERGGCWNYLPTSGGTEPGSEAETRVLMKFIETHNIEALISYHSAALGVFPGGLPWEESSIRFAEALADVSSYPFPPIDTGCTYSGTLADYAVSQGIAAVDLELTNHFDTDLDQNLDVLNVLLNFVP